MRISIVILTLLIVAGCQSRPKFKMPEEPKEPGSDRLNKATESAYMQPPCNSVVANEWGHMWPVPLAGKQSRFSLLYYPVIGGFGKPWEIYSPSGKAVIDLDAGGPVSCSLLDGRGPMVSQRLYPDTTKLHGQEFRAHLFRLFDRTERVAALYRSGNKLAQADLALLNEYFDLFEQMSEPDFKAEYYRQNPDFWEWLRQAIGKSLPKS